ncbi:hypothetical protein SAMN02927937_00124 [Paenimyroides aquimaris]|uniref:Lipoprotein n=1 Tax=Paenimyroides marinum TaxID=1159016 RepID=A0A1H6J337_9FLAO|nr:hypothetical protein [Paenimyroides aquimaris]SEH54638.1 hypothetical protein SAMN02927937_00124 [Paenimyroides aquimaris]
MKHFLLVFLVVFLISCTKEKDTIAEKFSDEYTIEWVKFDYDSIKGRDKNYQLLELLIPKDKTKDTLFNQTKVYVDDKLSKKYSRYYDLEVSATEKKHVYKAKIKMYSEYSKLKTDESNERKVSIFYLNYYKDSLDFKIKDFEDTDEFEIEFENHHNDRFTGRITEGVYRDTIINNERMINARITKIAVTNKTTTSNFFIVNDSIFDQQKFSLKGMYKTE